MIPPSHLRLAARRVDRRARQLAKVAVNHRGRRGYFTREAVFDQVGRWSPALVAEFDGLRYLVSTADRGLSRIVFCQGSYEQDIMAFSFELLHSCTKGPGIEGRTFIDVGANIGTSTVPAVRKFGASDAVSFEPEPANFRLLQCNVALNDLASRVRAVNSALSDHSGTARMEWDAASWGDHRLRTREGLPDGSYQESERPVLDVAVTRFDDAAATLGVDLDKAGVVWMDVQGHEGHVLAGAESILASEIPIVMEYWPYGLRRADGLDLLHAIVAKTYRRVIDVRASMASGRVCDRPADEMSGLVDHYPQEAYTDVILLK